MHHATVHNIPTEIRNYVTPGARKAHLILVKK